MLSLAPPKRLALSARGPPPEPRSLPPYAEQLAKQAQSGLVMATEVIEPVAPPLLSDADNSGEEQVVTEAAASQAEMEPQVEAVLGAAMS